MKNFILIIFILISTTYSSYCQRASSIIYVDDYSEVPKYKLEIDTQHLAYDFQNQIGHGYTEYSKGWLINKGKNTYTILDNFFKDSIPINIESYTEKKIIGSKYKMVNCRISGTADEKYIRNSIFVIINDTLKIAIDSFPFFTKDTIITLQVESNDFNFKSKRYTITNKRFNIISIIIPLSFEECYSRNLNGDSIVITGFSNAVWIDAKNKDQVYLRKISCDELNNNYPYLGMDCPVCVHW